MEQLWVDKYRPKNLDDFIYNRSAAQTLKCLAKHSTDIPHLIIEGVSGIGKKSIAMAFVKECLDQYGLKGNEVYRTSNLEISLKYPNKKIDMNIQKSLFHYNLNPSDYGIYDRHIVQDFLKSQFRYKQLTGFPYKTVLIRDAENLSMDAQQSLRRTLENCIKNCRFVFFVNTEKQGNLIMALNSRCIRIRMAAPTKDEAYSVVQRFLDLEGIKVNDKLIKNLYKKCQGNLSHTINLLQFIVTTTAPDILANQITVNMPDICLVTNSCNDIVTKMFSSEDLNLVTHIRIQLYTLLTHGVNAEEIVKRIFKIVSTNLVGLELKVVKITDDIEMKLKKSSREFYHLESYIVQLLVLIKRYQLSKQQQKITTKKNNLASNTETKKIKKIENDGKNDKDENDKDEKENNDKLNDIKENKDENRKIISLIKKNK